MITIENLIRLSEIIKIKKICEECNINYSTIMAKINRRTELSIKESEIIQTFLLGYGLKFQDVSQMDSNEIKKQ